MKRSALIFGLILFTTAAFGQEQKIPYGNNPAAGQYFQSGDAKLYFEIYGKGDPVLLLHGGVYGYIDEFEFLIEKLSKQHQVICLATRGHGKSEIGHTPFSYKQRAEDGYQLLRHLKIEKAMVIGFSDGGHSGYVLAALHPETVTRLVAIGAGDYPIDPKRKKSDYTAAGLTASSGDFFKGRIALMPEPQRWNEDLAMINVFYNNDVVSKETFNKITCPVLVMGGDHDDNNNAELLTASFRMIKDSQLSIIPGCGHVILYCNFPAVWDSMEPFVNPPKQSK